MAQGNRGLSGKKNTNTRHHERRASKLTKKGGMVIKSKKQSVQRHLKTKIALEKAITKNIEGELMNRADEPKPFFFLKKAAKVSATGKIVRAMLTDRPPKPKAKDADQKAAAKAAELEAAMDPLAMEKDSDEEDWVTEPQQTL
eukprot:m.50036 g.50036  ORF g.50036 m.50036 type:complete len:143 (-) comp13387_c0_seq1:1074-1502(-)